MHNVGIAFDVHELAYFDTSRYTDSPGIIASKIDQHHMFSSLFRIIFQLIGEFLISVWVPM